MNTASKIFGLITLIIAIVLVTKIIKCIVDQTRGESLVRKYIKEGGGCTPKVEIVKNELGVYGVKVLSPHVHGDRLIHRSLCIYLYTDLELRRVFMENPILKTNRCYTPFVYVKFGDVGDLSNLFVFNNQEDAELAVKCLYDSHDQIRKSKEVSVVVDDCREKYYEECIQKNMKKLEEFRKQK